MRWLRASSSCSSASGFARVNTTRDEAREDVFNYIELFYNPSRRHGNNEGLSPVNFEKQHYHRVKSVD